MTAKVITQVSSGPFHNVASAIDGTLWGWGFSGHGRLTIKEFKNDAGTTKVFSVGNNKILSGTATLSDETPGSYSISADNWKMVTFNDSIYYR